MKRIIPLLGLLCLNVVAASRPYQSTLASAPEPSGYYVAGKSLYRPDGSVQSVHGTNVSHWNNWGGAAAVKLSGANVARLTLDFTQPTAMAALVDAYVAAGVVPIVGNWKGTCKSDTASLVSIVDTWVAQAPVWRDRYAKTALINIANEWGPPNSTVWRDQYIAAVGRMRAAGYTQTLVIDSGGCGQDAQDIVKYGPTVLAADPQRNVLFDVHVYGSFHWPKATAAWQQDYEVAFAALGKSGLPIMVGEYGPGQNVGPSPTLAPPEAIIASVKQYGLVGELSWAWDDNNLPNCAVSDTGWFGMANKCGKFTGLQSELTAFGRKMVPIMRFQNGLPALPWTQ